MSKCPSATVSVVVSGFAITALCMVATLTACAATPTDRSGDHNARRATSAQESNMFRERRVTLHREGDDLLTAGLGLSGLRALTPPAFATPAAPTAAEVRRRALWSNWRGIADLAPGGGYGELYGSVASVPGREFSAYATVPGARHPHRVLAQVPDAFDRTRRCLVVAASSGSRGIYGAIAVAGAWGLPKGCAVVYTDKGAGSDYVDLATRAGVRADGTPGDLGSHTDLAFVPETTATDGIAFKHAHSQDNPEADWGRHVRQAADFGLAALDEAFPDAAPFTPANTRIIAVGISNGGGAVLRAAELDGDWLDAVVAGEPNVLADGHGARALYDYATEAGLLMPCALLAVEQLPQPPLRAQVDAQARLYCASLRAAGLVDGDTPEAQARDALARLRAGGWTDAALRAGAASAGFDLWRAVGATYASAYGRFGVDAHPCGYRYAAQAADGSRHPPSPEQRAAWWSDGSGIPPGTGIGLVRMAPDAHTDAAQADAAFAGLRCLRGLWQDDDASARRVRAGVAATRAAPPRAGLPVFVIHGTDDGLIPMAFSSAPYVATSRAAGRDVRFWQVRNAQHFDAFLGFPDYGARWVPLLPYVYAALDRSLALLEHGTALPGDATIETVPRAGRPLDATHLAMP